MVRLPKLIDGQSLVEVMIAIGLATIVLPAVYLSFMTARQGKAQQLQRVQASNLLQEMSEATRLVRDHDWVTFAVNGVYHPEISGNAWVLVAGAQTIDGYTRSLTISDTYRDFSLPGSPIVETGGSEDPSTKKVTYTVSWPNPFPSDISSVTYLTRLDNIAYTDTTYTQFGLGTAVGTGVTYTTGSSLPDDGQVQLGAGGGGGDWCTPSQSVTTVDLSRQGIPTAISVYPGNIVTGTGGNASGPTFVKTSVSGNNPPVATFVGEFDNFKANGVFTEDNYGYITTTDHTQEIKILDLDNPSGNPPTFPVIGWFDAPAPDGGPSQAHSIFVTNNVGYVTAYNKFYTFSLGSGDQAGHSGSRPRMNTTSPVVLSGVGNKVVVVGNYAFVAVESTTAQMEIIDVTDPYHPVKVAWANLGNNQPGKDISVNTNGTRAYIVTAYASAGQPDFFIVDTSVPAGALSALGSGFNTAGMSPLGVAVATGNRVIIVGTGGTEQYQVVRIDNEASPTYCAGLPITNGAFAVSSIRQDDGYAYSYIVTGDTHAELKMILGGAGGEFTSSGSFESATLSTDHSTAFNRFQATVSQPPNTTLELQVAVAKADVSGSCDGVSFTYLGPEGQPDQFFTTGSDPTVIQGIVPLLVLGNYSDPGQCFRYKAYFTSTESTATPVIYDFTVNYSP